MIFMTKLKAGDVRQEGDEQRRNNGNYHPRFRNIYYREFLWRPVDLIGHKILQSDLMAFEFQRP